MARVPTYRLSQTARDWEKGNKHSLSLLVLLKLLLLLRLILRFCWVGYEKEAQARIANLLRITTKNKFVFELLDMQLSSMSNNNKSYHQSVCVKQLLYVDFQLLFM